MFAEIVPEQLRSAVYAFDRSFEGAIGATAAPLVGGASVYSGDLAKLGRVFLQGCDDTAALLSVLGHRVDPLGTLVSAPWVLALHIGALIKHLIRRALTGIVAEEVFGFKGSLADSAVPDPALQLHNARALGNAMLILLLVPWGLDFFFYCGAR
jgi:hypothetical protein